jgi:hypothetical protein
MSMPHHNQTKELITWFFTFSSCLLCRHWGRTPVQLHHREDPPPQEHVGVTCLLSPWRARRGQPPSAVLRHGRRRNKVPADAEFLYVQSIDAIRHHSRPPLMSTSALVLPPWRGINGEPQPPRRPQMGPLHRGDAPRHLPHQLQASSSPDLAGVVGSHHWRPASPVSGSRGPPAHRQACL